MAAAAVSAAMELKRVEEADDDEWEDDCWDELEKVEARAVHVEAVERKGAAETRRVCLQQK